MITKFLSNKWNLYGVQVLACVLMILVLNDSLTIGKGLVLALCVYLIASCQRILGVAKGMLVYAIDKEKLIDIVNTKYREVQKEGRERVRKEVEEKKRILEEKRQLKKNAGIEETENEQNTKDK